MAFFLVAFWLYNDGIGTIIKIATAYGDEIGIDHNHMLIALILTQLVGFPSTLGFGALAQRLGAKRSIFLGLAVYLLISIAGFFMRSAAHFYLLAVVVGLVQGRDAGAQPVAIRQHGSESANHRIFRLLQHR